MIRLPCAGADVCLGMRFSQRMDRCLAQNRTHVNVTRATRLQLARYVLWPARVDALDGYQVAGNETADVQFTGRTHLSSTVQAPVHAGGVAIAAVNDLCICAQPIKLELKMIGADGATFPASHDCW